MDRDPPDAGDNGGPSERVPAGEDAEETLDVARVATSPTEGSSANRPPGRPTDTIRLKPGTLLLGRFRIVRLLGQGGMGAVYEAEDLELRESIALKTILPEVVEEPELRERFRREVQLARRVTHRNVCRLFDLFLSTDGDRAFEFLTMELLRGETLADVLQAKNFMPPDVALPIALEIVAGLDAAHRAGVIHRDFKTSNVFIERGEGKDGRRVVITDFGLARSVAGAQGASSITGSDRIVGSPAYMAPEQVLGHTLTAQTDIYSLGVVLFEMVTGQRPFLADSPLAVALRRLQEDPSPPSTLRPGLPAEWDATILKCLERDPERRFSDVRLIGLSLTQVAAEPTILLPARVGAVPPAISPSRRRLAALATLLLLTAAWAAWNALGPSRRSPALRATSDATVSIGVAPFNPLSSEARGEAETMRQLVFQKLADLIGERSGVHVIAVDAFQPPRTQAEARSLGQKHALTMVVWGTAAVLRGEVSIEPHAERIVERRSWFEPVALSTGDIEPLRVTESALSQLSLRMSKAEDVTGVVVSLIAPQLPDLVSLDSTFSILSKIDSPESYFYRAQFAPRKFGEESGAEKARLELESGLSKWPNSAILHLGFGRLQIGACRRATSGRPCNLVAARAYLERALSLDPALYQAAEALAGLSVDAGDLSGGATILKASLGQLGSRTPSAWKLGRLAALFEWCGRQDSADGVLERITPLAGSSDFFSPLLEHGIYSAFADLALDLSELRDDARNIEILRANIGLGRDARVRDLEGALEKGRARVASRWRTGVSWVRTFTGFSSRSDDLVLSTGVYYPLGYESWLNEDLTRWMAQAELFSGHPNRALKLIEVPVRPGEAFWKERQLVAWVGQDWPGVIRLRSNQSMGERGYVDETEVLAFLAALRIGRAEDPANLVVIRSRVPALAQEEEVFVDVLRGVTSEKDALDAATGGRIWSCRQRWIARMSFYLGALHAARRDVPAAETLFERSIATKLGDDWAYRLAELELRRLGRKE